MSTAIVNCDSDHDKNPEGIKIFTLRRYWITIHFK